MKDDLNLFYRNIKILLKYKYFPAKNKISTYFPKYNVYIGHNEVIFNSKNSQTKKKFMYESTDFNGNFKEYIKAPFIFMNEFFVNSIISVKNNWLFKNCFIYLYYEDLNMFLEWLQVVDILPILLGNNVYFVFGIEELKYTFSKQSIKFPENYVHVSEFIKKELYSIKFRQIEILKTKIDEYYNNCINLNIKKNDFKILLFCKGMGMVYYKQFVSALTYGNFKYEVANNVNDFSSSLDEYAFLNYLYIYKPNAILGIDLTYYGFPYYLNKRIIILSYLDRHIYLFNNNNFISNIGSNTFLLLPCLTLKEYIDPQTSNFKDFDTKTTTFPFTCNINEYRTYILNKSELNKYKSDISIIGFFPQDYEVLFQRFLNKSFMKNVENSNWYYKLKSIFEYIFLESYNCVNKEEKFIWNIKKFKPLFVEKCKNEKIYFDISSSEFDTFFITVYYLTAVAAFRYNILDWLIERDYNFSMWGYPSIIGNKFEKYAKGYISHGMELSKVYNASKISISTNPNFGLHTRLFEAISSNCLFLVYKSVFDISKVETIFKKNIDSYSTKSELYNKLDYYLLNKSEREKRIKSTKKIILNKKLYSDEIIKCALEDIIYKINKLYKLEKLD